MKSLVALVALAAAVSVAHAADVTPAPSGTPKRDPSAPRVQITLISDGETWVSIANVQQPAKFQKRTVSLPPGDYEVVGRRKGYRDVEKSLPVRSGEAPKTMTIICTVSADSRAP